MEPHLSDPDRTELIDTCLAGVLAIPPLELAKDREENGADAIPKEVGIPGTGRGVLCTQRAGIPGTSRGMLYPRSRNTRDKQGDAVPRSRHTRGRRKLPVLPAVACSGSPKPM